MKHIKFSLLLVLLFVFSNLFSQKTSKQIIYDSYVSGKMNVWKGVVDKMEQNKINSTEYLLELVEYQYGYIAWCIGNDKKNEGNIYLQSAIENLQKAEELGADQAIINSYKSAFVGFEIGISPPKAPFIGKKSVEYSEKAMETGSQMPIVLINYGNLLAHMPGFMGGDKEEAIVNFIKAKKIMENNSFQTKHNWLYLNLLTLLGKVYQQVDDKERAKYYYEYALEVEPDFQYVKQDLLPSLSK